MKACASPQLGRSLVGRALHQLPVVARASDLPLSYHPEQQASLRSLQLHLPHFANLLPPLHASECELVSGLAA